MEKEIIESNKILYENKNYIYWLINGKLHRGKLIGSYGHLRTNKRVQKNSIKEVKVVYQSSTDKLKTFMKKHSIPQVRGDWRKNDTQ